MVDTLREWKYTDLVSETRRAALAAPGSFEELVRLVTEDARDIRAQARRGMDPGLTGCIQAIFSLELPDTGDALFNGPWGYRAQYWQLQDRAWRRTAYYWRPLPRSSWAPWI